MSDATTCDRHALVVGGTGMLADVVLGHVVAPGGTRRWLADAEICCGVVAAIDADPDGHVIGTTG